MVGDHIGSPRVADFFPYPLPLLFSPGAAPPSTPAIQLPPAHSAARARARAALCAGGSWMAGVEGGAAPGEKRRGKG